MFLKRFKKFFNYLMNYSENKVSTFGESYKTFGYFGLINYPVSYIYYEYILRNSGYENFIFRLGATLLCFLLVIKDLWPKNITKYLPLYWHFTIMFTIPFFGSFMLLKNDFSSSWLTNMALGFFLEILLVDGLTFLIITVLGIILGLLFYYLLYPNNIYLISIDTSSIIHAIYLYVFAIVIGVLFARKRENIQQYIVTLLETKVTDRTKALQKISKEHELILYLNNTLTEKVRERTAELEKALAVKTEFLNNISHEVRTPIHGVTAITQGIVDHWDILGDSEKKEFAKQAAMAANRLFSLVNNILDLSKMTNNKLDLHLAKVDLYGIANEVVEESKEIYLHDKKIDLTIQEPKNKLPILTVDKQLITQVFRNLITNAIKFTKEGKIEIIFEIKDDELIVQIRDEGVGIPAAEVKEIFTAFTQSSRTKTRAGGTGLGLAICKEIVEMHEGKIWAENNNPAAGSSFYFALPINENKTQEVDTESVSKINILLIDDERICIESMKMMLAGSEFEITGAEGGSAGLAYLVINSHKVDLILLDMMMPDMYGLEVLEKIKNNPQISNIPVILQTGLKKEEEIQKAYDIGIVNFIGKPYKKDEILKVLRTSVRFKLKE